MKMLKFILALFLLFALAASCTQKPRDIHYGSDECAHCKMMITDNRFASQMVTNKGKVLKFDAIECMAEYLESHKTELADAKKYVSIFNKPGSWKDINSAFLVQSEVINSPMGKGYLALPTEEERTAHLENYSGRPVEWETLVK